MANSNLRYTQVLDTNHKSAPYRLNLNNGFVPGNEVTITGVPSYSGQRFTVDFVSQSYNNRDISLHWNVRFDESAIVRNSQFTTNWGHEERDGGVPIFHGQSFTANFRCEQEGIRMYINGAMFSMFRHRQAPGLISHVMIHGAIAINTVTYQANVAGPGFGFQKDTDIPLQNSFTDGCELTIVGMAQPFQDRFSVNLQSGQGPSAEKLLHYNPRLREGVVVRNSYQAGRWGSEERDGGLPIQPGVTFTLLIRCEIEGFKIYVNGKMHAYFIHRLSPQRITTLQISGGITLSSVSYHSKMA